MFSFFIQNNPSWFVFISVSTLILLRCLNYLIVLQWGGSWVLKNWRESWADVESSCQTAFLIGENCMYLSDSQSSSGITVWYRSTSLYVILELLSSRVTDGLLIVECELLVSMDLWVLGSAGQGLLLGAFHMVVP